MRRPTKVYQLNPSQTKFVSGYVQHGNAAKAARDAGYAVKSARVTACRLLTKANIQAEIAAERRRYELSLGIDRGLVTRELLTALDLARTRANPAQMIAAAKEIGLMCGYYEQSNEIKVHPNINANRPIDRFETMSDSELASMVREKDG